VARNADKQDMSERRNEPRMLCANLVHVSWRDRNGHECAEVMNMEDISLSGACLLSETPVPSSTRIVISYGNGRLPGIVRHSEHRELGYFLGVEFADGCQWPTDQFRPRHLLDPRALLERASRPNWR
jgi:hypothetical protein